MLEIKLPYRRLRVGIRPQEGVAAIEFSLVALIFFTLVFGVIDVARLMYLYNTLEEVTRRAASSAANADFSNPTDMQNVRTSAIFRTAAGNLALTNQVSDQTVRIEYLSIAPGPGGVTMTPIPTGSLPSSPSDNYKICMVNPHSANCISLIRVRICDPADSGSCLPVQFRSIVPLINLPVALPTATTVVKAESLGFVPITPPGP